MINIISKELIHTILDQYTLPWRGIHGISHWARVFENGCQLAQANKAKVEIIQLFAIFHDIKRVNEGRDRGHGYRGAEYAASLRGKLFQLSDTDFNLLYWACTHHTDSLVEGDITVQTCWDADRLDLGRVNIRPHSKYLCTQAAQDPNLITWATQRARKRILPKLICNEWGIKL